MKVLERDKRKGSRAEPKIEVHGDCAPVKGEAESGSEPCAWRQRCPTTIFVTIPPGYPRGAPDGIRCPAPSQLRKPEPSPIMERSPTPRVIGKPVPPAVGALPASAVKIGAPIGIPDRDRRLPAASITAH